MILLPLALGTVLTSYFFTFIIKQEHISKEDMFRHIWPTLILWSLLIYATFWSNL